MIAPEATRAAVVSAFQNVQAAEATLVRAAVASDGAADSGEAVAAAAADVRATETALAAAMAKVQSMPPKVDCPVCASNAHVKTLGGGTLGKYRYECRGCNCKWQQVPPSKAGLAEGDSTGKPILKRKGEASKPHGKPRTGGYASERLGDGYERAMFRLQARNSSKAFEPRALVSPPDAHLPRERWICQALLGPSASPSVDDTPRVAVRA